MAHLGKAEESIIKGGSMTNSQLLVKPMGRSLLGSYGIGLV